MISNNISRRHFLKLTAVGGALLINIPQLAASSKKLNNATSTPWCIYLTIKPDNTVEMISPIMEMGQFMRTTGPMVIADEADLDWSLISFRRDMPTYIKRNEKGDVVYDHAQVGTGGSHTLRNNWEYLRTAGATIRQLLLEEASHRWNVDIKELTTKNNFVYHNLTQQKFSYGELAEKAALRTIDESKITYKSPKNYQIIGTERKAIDAKDIVTGAPLYGMDATYPNLLHAVIERAPSLGATLVSYNKQAALSVPGVVKLVEIKQQFMNHWPEQQTQVIAAGVAVVANDLWSAMQGRKQLNAQWRSNDIWGNENSESQLQQFNQQVKSAQPAELLREEGDFDTAIETADIILDEVYEKPLFAHACMEPMNCLIDIRSQDATIVFGHQWPHSAANEIEKHTGIDALNVEIQSRRMGGGFGRRGELDYLLEAVHLGYQLKHPVKIVWTREDDLSHDFYDPAAVMRIKAGLKNGKPIAWLHRQAQTKGKPRLNYFPANLIPNFKVERFATTSKIPAGTWRAPLLSSWTFASESMIDELAYAAKQDPLVFRLNLLKPHTAHPFGGWGSDVIDSGRMASCYEAAAKLADWHRPRPQGTGLGIAGTFCFGSYAAFVLEVSVDSEQQLTLHQAWGAIDCGRPINPNHIRAQMEGGFIDGLNSALFNKANIKNSQVENNNFHQLRWMRLREAPVNIEVTIVNNGHESSGVGEPPTPPAFAALTNAIYAACGKRIRRLPVAESLNV